MVVTMKFSGALLSSGLRATTAHSSFSRSGAATRVASRALYTGLDAKNLPVAALIQDTEPINNITPNILSHMNARLLHQPNHPLQIIKTRIAEHFKQQFPAEGEGKSEFKLFDDLHPVVSAEQCFDDLLIPADHVGRQPSDTYYVNPEVVLRTHTSAHQCELINAGHRSFLCAGDVYRRDAIDASHYPVFHQMEGVRIFPDNDLDVEFVQEQLKKDLGDMVRSIFGDVEQRWVDAYFPFTEPSLELEILFEGEWLEVLGCGVIAQPIMDKCNVGHLRGYAFGLGLERLAMVLFGIPDIRLFWTQDERFLSQFQDGSLTTKTTKFKPYSKYPICYQDVSFWLPENESAKYSENDFYALVRTVGGELVEKVELIDSFVDKKTGRESHCYRIVYRSMDRNLSNKEVDVIQGIVRKKIESQLGGEVR